MGARSRVPSTRVVRRGDQGPAENASAEGVEHDGQIQGARLRRHAGDMPPEFVGPRRRKVTTCEIGNGSPTVASDGRTGPIPPTDTCSSTTACRRIRLWPVGVDRTTTVRTVPTRGDRSTRSTVRRAQQVVAFVTGDCSAQPCVRLWGRMAETLSSKSSG